MARHRRTSLTERSINGMNASKMRRAAALDRGKQTPVTEDYLNAKNYADMRAASQDTKLRAAAVNNTWQPKIGFNPMSLRREIVAFYRAQARGIEAITDGRKPLVSQTRDHYKVM